MYSSHFGLEAQPFGLSPDPKYLYLSPEHREAMAAVQYGVLDRRGFLTLVGEVGTGKTTILYSLISRFDREIQTAYIAYTLQSFEELLAAALRDLGVQAPGTSKADLLRALNGHLVRAADQG